MLPPIPREGQRDSQLGEEFGPQSDAEIAPLFARYTPGCQADSRLTGLSLYQQLRPGDLATWRPTEPALSGTRQMGYQPQSCMTEADRG